MSCNGNERKIIGQDVTWKDITKGGNITDPGNAETFKTGDWRSRKPVYSVEKCKQCWLCNPVCPDVSIKVNEEGKRIEIDYDHCKGCGICASVCPFKAIEMVDEDK